MLKKVGCICGWHSKQEIEILYLAVAFRIAAWSLSAVTASGKTVMVSGVAPLTGMTMIPGVPVTVFLQGCGMVARSWGGQSRL